MKCQLCEETEFDIIYNCDHPIEAQPVIICLSCAEEHLKDSLYRAWRKTEKGKRCQ